MKAVIVLHGFLTSIHDFDPLYPYLEELYDHVEKFDFPGHGDKPDYDLFTVDDSFAKMIECFDELSKTYSVIDVIGFSMGGAMATYLANKRSFNRLVLLAPANKFLNISLPINRIIFFFKSVLKRMNKKRLSKGDIKRIDRNMGDVRTDDIRSVNMALTQLIPNYSYHTLSTFIRIIMKCNKELTAIKNPTLIIWGQLDQLVPKSSILFDYNLCLNDDKRLVILDDISHLMLQSRDRKKIIKEIVEFLNK